MNNQKLRDEMPRIKFLRDTWLFKHRETVESLLDKGARSFFNSFPYTFVERFPRLSDGSLEIVPFKQVEVQPDEIQFGEMKDYQLYGLVGFCICTTMA